MKKRDKRHPNYLQILTEELVPALGCTEPIAVAYAAVKARDALGCLPDTVHLKASGSIIKNVKSVIVPNTAGMKGFGAAVAAGMVGGDPHLGLEVLSGLSRKHLAQIRDFVQQVPISVEPLQNGRVFDIVLTARKGSSHATVRIADSHTNIVLIEKDGAVLLEAPAQEPHTSDRRPAMSMAEIWEFANSVAVKDVQPLVRRQADYNWAIAEEGIRRKYGSSVGKVMLKTGGETIRNRAAALAAAGSDARMNGCDMPVVINSGSGNQGITVSVPVVAYGRALAVDDERVCRALVLSNLTAIYIKEGIGRLSAYCGAVCAGAAAAAGIAFLHGGDYCTAAHTVENALAISSGMVCDGAKSSCAAKIAVSVNAGILGYELYAQGHRFSCGDGIVMENTDATIRGVGMLAKEGMRQTNEVIVGLMTRL